MESNFLKKLKNTIQTHVWNTMKKIQHVMRKKNSKKEYKKYFEVWSWRKN
jgi:hypothetical protein